MAISGALLTRMAAAAVSVCLAAGFHQPPAAAQTQIQTPSRNAKDARVFVHPRKIYTLSVPPGARIVDSGGRVDISIRSEKGYRANVQSGTANPGLDLPGMAAKLEAAYLGPGKAWRRKTGERDLKVAGLPAYDALYEGKNIQARVVVIRGAKTDFVFIFFAPPGIFDDVTPEFDWMLGTFRPAATELAGQGTAPAPSEPVVGDARTTLHFKNQAYGMDYPADWKQTTPRPDIVLFQGGTGTDAGRVSVAIQDVDALSGASPRHRVARVVAEMKSQLAAGARDVVYLDNGAFAGGNAGGSGWQFQVVYTLKGERMKQRTVIVPGNGGDMVHIWTYAAPTLAFDRYGKIAENMLATWTLRNAAGAQF